MQLSLTCRLTEGGLLPLDLEDPDEQCSFNRSGILCGACQTHFSHVLEHPDASNAQSLG